MPLPDVTGWLLDFETAQNMFNSENNEHVEHCIEMCEAGTFRVAYAEETLFKNHTVLCAHFVKPQNRIVYPTPEIFAQCGNISKNPKTKTLMPGNQSAIILTAIAASEGYGLISDARSTHFCTVFDLCDHFGFHALSSEKYFLEL